MAEEIKISKNTFIGSTSEPITTSYNLEKKIGDGTYGCVYLSTDKRNGLKRAIKQIPRTKIKNIKRLETEIEIMRRTDHPNIVKMYDVVDDGRNVYLVMEVCAGGELIDYIVD
jgi:calcium-dependent protein kinase